ncbi:hypothetical protein TNCV_158751 [Trichonephila clavipes]|uniref:Uncharacterized protein n=1 Tax=Trichonephila clavipes TaxID=2585209 RepID=A0A8X6R8Y8_TRICX|nr:hypothetical protein TNCV_158751 [Trichonephila clavipes]
MSLALALSTIQYDLALFHLNFEGKLCGGGQRPPTSLPLSPTSPEDLRLDGNFRVPSCREGTIHLQTSMPSPGFEPRSHGTAVSVTNHNTGWADHYHIDVITSENTISYVRLRFAHSEARDHTGDQRKNAELTKAIPSTIPHYYILPDMFKGDVETFPWDITGWNRIIFSDESRFEFSPDHHRRHVWKHQRHR